MTSGVTTKVEPGVRVPRERNAALGRLLNGERVATWVVRAAALSIVILTLAIAWELWSNSVLSRHRFGFGFLVTQTWDPVTEQFGALPFIYGTVVTAALSLVIAVPAGVAAAIFLAELAPPKLSDAMTFLIELLAAVPSVIYGLIGFLVLVPAIKEYLAPPLRAVFGWTPFFSGPFYGVSFLSAGIVLSIMILPFIVSVSRQVLLAVPAEQREGALALGATKWESTWKVVVPFARQGIVGSIFLALARALGETMAVTMVVGNLPAIHASLFSPGYSIAAMINNQFTEATGDLEVHALIELGLVLFALTIVINGIARVLIHATSRMSAHAT